MKFGLSLFIKEAILFGSTMALGLYAAFYYYSFNIAGAVPDNAIKFTFADTIVLIIFIGAVFWLSRYKRAAHFSFKIFLVLVVFSGTQVVLGTIISSPWNLAAALSVYDIIAVYLTKHMVALARSMIEGGAVFGFLVPFEFKGFLYGKERAKTGIGENFLILGSGDIGLPLVFVASLAKVSLASAIITAAFSILGLFLTHLLFFNQIKRRAMAALPPIATVTIIGYLISQLW